MSTEPNAPAAPAVAPDFIGKQHFGFTAQEAAAIALRVPKSGNDWLDAMIRTAQRNEYAALAMQAKLSSVGINDNAASAICQSAIEAGQSVSQHIAISSYVLADAMLSGAQIAEGE